MPDALSDTLIVAVAPTIAPDATVTRPALLTVATAAFEDLKAALASVLFCALGLFAQNTNSQAGQTSVQGNSSTLKNCARAMLADGSNDLTGKNWLPYNIGATHESSGSTAPHFSFVPGLKVWPPS